VFVCIPPGKAVLEMTYTVSGGTLNFIHSLTLLTLPKIFAIKQESVIFMELKFFTEFHFKLLTEPSRCKLRTKLWKMSEKKQCYKFIGIELSVT